MAIVWAEESSLSKPASEDLSLSLIHPMRLADVIDPKVAKCCCLLEDERPTNFFQWCNLILVSPSIRLFNIHKSNSFSFNGEQIFQFTGLKFRTSAAVTAGGMYFSYVIQIIRTVDGSLNHRLMKGRSLGEATLRGQLRRPCIRTTRTSRCMAASE